MQIIIIISIIQYTLHFISVTNANMNGFRHFYLW